tara:strand:- start:1750 stop:2229 length:480 start_codon:yes stop_codon:yes gene_type:complete
MKCTADKKNGEKCENEAVYGTLCKIHARQLACTPMGFQRRRVLRLHHRSEPEALHDVAIAHYLNENEPEAIRTSSAMSYRWAVVEKLAADGEQTAQGIVDYVNGKSPYDLNHWKIGSLLRAMQKEGTIVRHRTTRNGKSTSVYLLRSQEHETGPLSEEN